MKDPYGLSKASIPISYAHLLLEIMVDKGFSALEILKKSKIPLTLLDQLDARITPMQWSKLAWESLILSKDSGLGYEYGIKLRLTAHGSMGYALMSSRNLRQAIEVSTQFFNMRLKDYGMTLLDDHEFFIIEIKETHPVVSNQLVQVEMLRRFFYECLMIGVIQASQFLIEHHFADIELWVDWSEPSYHKAYQHLLPTIHFNQATNQIRYKKQLLDLPIKMADPIAFKQALAQCEAEQLRFSEQIKDICLTVKAELNLKPQVGYPTFDEIADRLNMSSRTLRRHLNQVGSSYLQLLEEVQQKEAKNLLLNSDMEIQEIAVYLGYIQPTNFTRAFKKWTGITPIQFRKKEI